LFLISYIFVMYGPPTIFFAVLLYLAALKSKSWLAKENVSTAKRTAVYLLVVLHLAFTGIVIFVPVYFAFIISGFLMGAILIVAAVLFFFDKRKTGRWVPLPLHVTALLAFSAFIISLKGVQMVSVGEKILRQPEIRPIMMSEHFRKKLRLPDFDINSGNFRRLISDPGGKYLYASLSYFEPGISGLMRVNLDDLSDVKVMKLPGLHNFAFSKDPHVLYLTGYQTGEIYKIRVPEMKLLDKGKTIKGLQDIVLYEDKGVLLADDEKSRVYKIRLNGFKTGKPIIPPFMMMVTVIKKNPLTGRAHTYGDLLFSSFSEINEKMDGYSRRRIFPWGMGFDFSPDGKYAYLNETWFGYLHKVRLSDFHTVRKYFIRPGIRGVEVDPFRSLIYVGNYANGRVYILDMKTGKVITSAFFGKRVRDIYLVPKSHRLFVVSIYGLFEVDIDKILKKAQSR
jgi:hypothetical protein